MSRPSRKRAYGLIPEDESTGPDQTQSSLDDDGLQRSGKWSGEEETFANQLVIDFETGALRDCEDGCTLRSYLARKLNCAPMRISKKFAGRCIGKLAFVRRDEALITSSEKSTIDSSVIPVLGRPRNINRRPRKNQLRIQPTSDSDDYDQAYSGSSSPVRDELNEDSSSSSSDETEEDFSNMILKAQHRCDNDTRSLLFPLPLNSSYSNCKSAPAVLPSLTIDDFCYAGDFEGAYNSLLLPNDDNFPCYVDGDDWHDVLSYFCDEA